MTTTDDDLFTRQRDLAEMRNIWTTDQVKRYHRGHWFDADTMRFFNSRIGAAVYHGRDLVYFVSSERPPHGLRWYTVRSYDKAEDRVDTVGEFCGYRTRDAAHRAAAKIAADSLTD